MFYLFLLIPTILKPTLPYFSLLSSLVHIQLILQEWKGHVETEDSISKVNGRHISYVNHQGDGTIFFLIASTFSTLFLLLSMTSFLVAHYIRK